MLHFCNEVWLEGVFLLNVSGSILVNRNALHSFLLMKIQNGWGGGLLSNTHLSRPYRKKRVVYQLGSTVPMDCHIKEAFLIYGSERKSNLSGVWGV